MIGVTHFQQSFLNISLINDTYLKLSQYGGSTKWIYVLKGHAEA